MAEITFTAFIEKQLTNAKGEAFGFTAAEPHRKKQDDGTYKTTARTFHTVKGNAAAGFTPGQRVTIKGRQVTEPWQRDGETRYSLTVWADTVELAGTGNTATPRATEHADTPPEDPYAPTDAWATTTIPDDPNLPF